MSIPGIYGMGFGAGVSGGGGGGTVSITNQTVTAFGVGTQAAGYRLDTSGVVQRNKNGVYNTLETWRLSGASADYEARVTETGGAGITGGSAIGSWLGLGTSREWELVESSSGASPSTQFDVEIRLAASPFTVLDTAAIELNAIVF